MQRLVQESYFLFLVCLRKAGDREWRVSGRYRIQLSFSMIPFDSLDLISSSLRVLISFLIFLFSRVLSLSSSCVWANRVWTLSSSSDSFRGFFEDSCFIYRFPCSSTRSILIFSGISLHRGLFFFSVLAVCTLGRCLECFSWTSNKNF